MANRAVNLTRRDAEGYFHAVEFTATGRIKQNGTDDAYYLDWRQGGKRRRKSVGKDPVEALTQLKRLEAELNARAEGVPVATTNGTGKHPLSAAVADYLHEVSLTKKRKTRVAYDVALRYFLESCAKTYVEDVERRDLLEYAAFLHHEKELAARSIFNKFASVLSFLKSCGVRGVVGKNDWPRFTEEEPEVYEQAELETLFVACEPHERLWFEFFLTTGFREQEVMHVGWQDVNFTARTLRVSHKPQFNWSPKAYKEREVPMTDKLASALKAHRAEANLKCPLVFPTSGCKPKLDFWDCLKAVATRAGLNPENFWLHKFRATFATRCLAGGVDLRTVQHWLGHSDIESTMRYLKPSRSEQVRAKVNEIFA